MLAGLSYIDPLSLSDGRFLSVIGWHLWSDSNSGKSSIRSAVPIVMKHPRQIESHVPSLFWR
jgi:hypothetical protein